jgi:hypothetical protein
MNPELSVELASRLARVKLDGVARMLAEDVVAAEYARVGESLSMAEVLDAFDVVPELRAFSSSLRAVVARQDVLSRQTTELLQRFHSQRSDG